MGDHTRVFTHKTRFIVNTSLDVQEIHNETYATPAQWLYWFKVNKSANTFVNHRSYADVLKIVNSQENITDTRVSTDVHKCNSFATVDPRN